MINVLTIVMTILLSWVTSVYAAVPPNPCTPDIYSPTELPICSNIFIELLAKQKTFFDNFKSLQQEGNQGGQNSQLPALSVPGNIQPAPSTPQPTQPEQPNTPHIQY